MLIILHCKHGFNLCAVICCLAVVGSLATRFSPDLQKDVDTQS